MRNMLKIKIIASLVILLIMASCQSNPNQTEPDLKDEQVEEKDDSNEHSTPPHKEDDTNNNETEDENNTHESDGEFNIEQEMNNKMEELTFSEIEVEIDYPNDKEFEAEIEKDSHGHYKAKVEDELNNYYVTGGEAFDFIYERIKHVNITLHAEKDVIINDIIEAFNVDSDYDKIEIEITFHDGTKIEYND